MKLRPAMSFVEAKAVVTGEDPAPPRPHVYVSPAPKPKPPPSDGWQGFVRGLLADGVSALWSDRGVEARAYLFGRCLREDTIRAARLGYLAEDRFVGGIFTDKRVWIPGGILIPWFDGPDVVMVNIRRPDGPDPKYRTVRGSRRGRPYPSADVRPGKPLVIVEGEFEALLLRQELASLAPAVTFGSASDRPKGRRLSPILPATPWYVATDADPAGDKSADAWLATSGRCRRVRPPTEFKDWTEVAQGGVDLRRWWSDCLAGVESPALFTWDELSALRRGGAGPEPGIVIDRPDRARMRSAVEAIRCEPGDVTGQIDPGHRQGPGRAGAERGTCGIVG